LDTGVEEEGGMKVAQIARMVAKPGRRDELIAALEPVFPKAEREPGTELYVMLVNARTLENSGNGDADTEVVVTDHPDEVWFFELYDDERAVKAHDDGFALDEATSNLAPIVRELLAEPSTVVQAIPTRAKGIAVGP
jgi:quinol monooxygenase YgiN